ncbi:MULTISPECIES: phosphotransferase enzyme family protein [unclassified Kribbella]|uniref:phosphotransferase enzyme family protein n=1 Tax=unclassified Kribbella TaxID=2644121 RepID=UPI00301A5A2B
MHDEEILTGGNVAAEVVRIGSTVRKPALPQTPGIEAILEHLANKGFPGAPATMGIDDKRRHVVEYIPGDLADTLPLMTLDELHRIGRLIRELHDAMEDFAVPADVRWNVAVPDPAGGDLICHNDLAPWNLVRDGDRWVFIDWDNAGPSSRLWDLAYAAHGFVQFLPDGNPSTDAPRLRALVDGYGLNLHDRQALPTQLAANTQGMHDLLLRGQQTGEQPWSRLYAEGHANHWGPTAAYLTRHHNTWLTALM